MTLFCVNCREPFHAFDGMADDDDTDNCPLCGGDLVERAFLPTEEEQALGQVELDELLGKKKRKKQ